MNEYRVDRASLPLPLAMQMDVICNRFEDEWRTGIRPQIERFLDEVDDPHRSTLLAELLRVELDYRCRGGETPSPAEYEQRFPHCSPLISAVFVEARAGSDQPPTTRVRGIESELETGDDSQRTASRIDNDAPDFEVTLALPEMSGYELIGVLGRGGMGVVYKARHLQLDRLVALKMMLGAAHITKEQRRRFEREAKAVARLQHPNIVQIFEVGEYDDLPFCALEYVDGADLSRHFAHELPTPTAAAELVETISRAIHHAHDQGIAHRDLKPGNILLSKAGVPKVTDFGLARWLDDDSGQTKSGVIAGTPSYMAPEQARGEMQNIGPPTDVYALGAILYWAMTGRPPFVGPSSVETVRRVIEDDPVSPRQLDPALPRDLETICLKCLDKEPGNRYPTAAALADDLRRFLDGKPIVARPAGMIERSYRWCRRKPMHAVALGLLIVLSIGGPTLGTLVAYNANKRAINAEFANDRAMFVAGVLSKAGIEFQRQLKDRPDLQDLRESLLRQTLAGLEETLVKMEDVENRPEADARLDRVKAGVHQHLGQLLLELGKAKEAEPHLHKAHEIADALYRLDPNDARYVRNLAAAKNNLADLYDPQGQRDRVKESLLQALELRLRWVELEPRSLGAIQAVANSYYKLTRHCRQVGDIASADTFIHESLKWRSLLPNDDGDSLQLRREWGSLLRALGTIKRSQHDTELALAYYQQSLELFQALFDNDPSDFKLAHDLGITYSTFGETYLLSLKEYDQANEHLEESVQCFRQAKKKNPKNRLVLRGLWRGLYGLGTAQLKLEQREAASASFRECLDLCQTYKGAFKGVDRMLALGRCKQHAPAAEIAAAIRAEYTTNGEALYWSGCGFALAAEALTAEDQTNNVSPPDQQLCRRYVEQAIEALREAVKNNWADVVELETNPELDAIRSEAGFQALMAQVKQRVAEQQGE